VAGDNREGPLLTINTVRQALKADMLGTAPDGSAGWLTYYMADAERAEGVDEGYVQRPRGWQMPSQPTKWPEVQVPTVLIVVANTEGDPRPDGADVYRATYAVELGAVVRGLDDDDTWQQASVYGAALRAYGVKRMLALPGVDVEGVAWSGESYDDVPQVEARSLRMASQAFTVVFNGVVSRTPGLAVVPGSPLGDPGPYPAAQTVAVSINKAEE
jgi:hypothetical protein